MKIIENPVFETKIIRGVFTNQDLVVYPQGRMPDNLSEAVKFLFGEGAVVTQDCVNNHGCIRIIGASYVLNNVRTLNADFIVTELNTTEVFK